MGRLDHRRPDRAHARLSRGFRQGHGTGDRDINLSPCRSAARSCDMFGGNLQFRRNLSLSRFLVTRVSLPEFLSRREDAGSVAAAPRGEVEFRYTSFEGEDVVTTLDRAPVEDVARGLPVRRFGSHAGGGH